MNDSADAAEQSPDPADRADPNAPVVAGPGQYYRNMRYLMFVIFVAMGAWFGYDGWVAWPRMNQQIRQLNEQFTQANNSHDMPKVNALREQLNRLNGGKEKSDWDLGLQKMLAIALPIFGAFVLVRALYKSRGEYRLEGTTLHVPGHPAVPFENITEIDRRLWDRKGIAYVYYDIGDGGRGCITLDDFVYDRPPTDEIYKRIEDYVSPRSEEQAAEQPPQQQQPEGG
jgi:hypothetical protein